MVEILVSSRNAAGTLLRGSVAPSAWFGSSTRGTPLSGTAGPDALFGTGSGAKLTGFGGDDTYHIWDIADRVIETPGAGNDTVVVHATGYAVGYALPSHVENILVTADGGRGVGNKLDNLIVGDEGQQWLDGDGGGDVLTGGAGADTFVFRKGCGMDVVTDFQPGEDTVAIGGGRAPTGFAGLRAAMTQDGADVVLSLGGGDGVVFRGRRVSDFGADDFRLPIDTATLRPTFAEEFNAFKVSPTGLDAGMPTWRSTYWWGRTIPTNDEAEFYSDATAGADPFAPRADGVLDIRATPAAGLPAGLTYNSGVITSQTSAVQTYGYFEMRARLPSGQGFWPAFWLLPADGDWPPEIDAMEVIGSDTTYLHVNAHSKHTGAHTVTPAVVPTADLSAGYNTFGVSWRPDVIRWYLNGTEVHSAPTPPDMHRPMYMLANLAVGGEGSWPGPTDGTSSATMSIDHIRAYQFQDLAMPTRPSPTTMAVLEGTNAGQTLAGGAGADRVRGGPGSDTLRGGAGADAFIFAAGDGVDTIQDFQPGVDKMVFLSAAGAIATKPVSGGLEVAYGKDRIFLRGVASLATGDVVANAAEIRGTAGDDLIDRSASKEWLIVQGGDGKDTIRGGSGHDWIAGGRGDDTMRGGTGADSFAFRVWDGDDRVEDFRSGVDRLVFIGVIPATVHANPAVIGGVAGLQVTYGQASAGTTVDHGTATDSVFLVGATGLVQGDLVFA